MDALFRFAPSPNGRLHLGHAYSALLTAGAAERAGGTMLLRIEDIDPVRSKPEFDRAIIDDLHWLGLRWPEPVLRQSGNMAAYGAAAATLGDLLYPCFCSRAEVLAVSTGRDPDGAPLYSGHCRHLGKSEAEARLARGEPAQWRLRMDAAIAGAGALRIVEAPVEGIDIRWDRAAERQARPERWGDVVLLRKDTPTSYHLSVVVDDAAQGITHVTRGADLRDATDIHVLLQALLGLPHPRYAHHDLVLDAGGEKLSKSKNAPALADLRKAGWSAADVRVKLGFPL